jgi:hypothetical protein
MAGITKRAARLSETGMGAFIGDIEPEAGAARLRAALAGLG